MTTAMASSSRSGSQRLLLNDEQISRFITDGYLILDSGLPDQIHNQIYDRLQWVLHEDGNPGNNVLPAVPQMQKVLDSPVICGALESILGPNYLLHPHRFAHNNEPGVKDAAGARPGKGSHSFVGWHQDDHSPLSRPRHHYLRYAMILYYPQDTPVEMGPTQIIPATYLHRSLTDDDRDRGFQASGKAGTCVLVHFDLAHGGSLNVGDRTRHMIKFVFVRTQEPSAPSWRSERGSWQAPSMHVAPYESTVVWSHLWAWMSGGTRPAAALSIHSQRSQSEHMPLEDAELDQESAELDQEGAQLDQEGAQLDQASALLDQEATLDVHGIVVSAVKEMLQGAAVCERVEAINRLARYGAGAVHAVPALIEALEDEEPVRQNAIYALGAIGEPSVHLLVENLVRQHTNHWSEGATIMENSAYALAAIGATAVNALVGLLESSSEWVTINALFALGEIGSAASAARSAMIRCLRSASHPVVRTALDALGQIGADESEALPIFSDLLTRDNPEWQTLIRREWSGQDQVRTNAMMAILRLGWRSEEAFRVVAASLNDRCGYVTGLGIEILLRQSTAESLGLAISALRTHRWDETLKKGVRTF